MSTDNLLLVGAVLGAILTTLTLVEVARRVIVLPLREVLSRSRERDEDWYGVDARPGHPARPGVMATLAAHTEALAENRRRIERLEDHHVEHAPTWSHRAEA